MSVAIAATDQYELNTFNDYEFGANVFGQSDLSSAVSWQSSQLPWDTPSQDQVPRSVPTPTVSLSDNHARKRWLTN